MAGITVVTYMSTHARRVHGGNIMASFEAKGIPQQARTALSNSPIHALREVSVELTAEAIVLSGRVETFYHKQLAQEIVRTVLRDYPLVNSIHVEYAEPQ